MSFTNTTALPCCSKLWLWTIPTLALLMSIIIAATGANQALFMMINQLASHFSDRLWSNFTILGDTMVAFALLLPFVGRRPDIIWALLLAALAATMWVHVLKPLLDVPRPAALLATDTFHIIGPELHRGSFPSGHTTTAFTLAGVIILSITNPFARTAILILACCAGISRIAVGAHWPADVAAGMFGGWIAAVIGVY